jgi:hypothetical protein
MSLDPQGKDGLVGTGTPPRSPWLKVVVVAVLLLGACCGSLALGGLLLRQRAATLRRDLDRRLETAATSGESVDTAFPTPSSGAAEDDPLAAGTSQAYDNALATISALEGAATQAAVDRQGGTGPAGSLAGGVANATETASGPEATTGAGGGAPSGAADLAALGDYLRRLRPTLDRGLEAAQRDGQILEAARGDPSRLCPGGSLDSTLAADIGLMRGIEADLAAISAPEAARQSVHEPLQASARQWSEALEALDAACGTGTDLERGLRQLGAGAQLAGAALNFRVAVESYWRLVVTSGLDAFGGGRP